MLDNPEILLPVITALAAAVVFGWKWLKTRYAPTKKWLEKTSLDEIAEGAATEVYQDLVRDLKAEGNFDSAAKKAAMSKALDTFKRVGKEQGLEEAKRLATPIAKSLIEKAITRLKRGE